jgi:uncharacterized protein
MEGALLEAQRRHFRDRGHLERQIACGPLLSDDGAEWVGSAMPAELADREAFETMLAGSPYARAGLYRDVEVHAWRFGGRR